MTPDGGAVSRLSLLKSLSGCTVAIRIVAMWTFGVRKAARRSSRTFVPAKGGE
jgi:hypothetical protein